MTRPSDPTPDELSETLYCTLRAAARAAMARERQGHTLQPTALVHEAMLRMAKQRSEWQNRRHLLAIASKTMRRVLLDHARRRQAAKRPDDLIRVTLSGLPQEENGVDIVDLYDALHHLEQLDPRAARIVELRGLVGCTLPEAAELTGVSLATAERDWRFGRSWLRRELSPSPRG